LKPIIPENERSAEPLDTEMIIYHPDMKRANEWILTEYQPPVRDFCIFVPCAKKKPYHESPSHKIFDRLIFGILESEMVHIVVFGTCGITPRELDTQYPFMDYQFMMGKCNVSKIKRDFIKMESERIARYLEKTKNNYKYRIAYCIGDFRTAMEKAVEMTSIPVTIVPKIETIEKNIQPTKNFIYGSLNQKDYLQDLAEAISKPLGKLVEHIDEKEEVINDNDWYVL
jgi:predicted RNA-binding protein